MFEGFTPFNVTTQAEPHVTISGVASGDASSSSLPPLLLIHGFPQTHHMWHRVAPQLTSKYTVVVPDIRGYGASSKPKDLASYAKSAMARDMIALMDSLGFKDKFFVCAHDRGARVTHKLCVDFPERVAAAILLDICPTLAMYSSTDFVFAKAYFHWFFLIQQEPLPEKMITNDPSLISNAFMGGLLGSSGTDKFGSECFAKYTKGLGDYDTVHGMCQDYRAGASLDLEEQKADLEAGRLIRCPLRVIWGAAGLIEKKYDCVAEWKKVTDPSVKLDGYKLETSHWIPDEAPDEVVKAILEVLV
ncbi:hypothetical protein K4F52_001714 [Lecanicillium sp. MT-2017a]|nr:hypothetical protein K4F52_001714 [Lecanicillium sp. MT-2017a]